MTKSAYIVSAGRGLESFIFREIDEMKKVGVDIVLFTTKFNGKDVYSPKPDWQVEKISYAKILISTFLNLLRQPLITLRMMLESLKYRTLTECLIAFDFSRRMKRHRIKHIHCHFGDRKFFIGVYCKKILKVKLSLTVHAHEIYANPNERFFRVSIMEADKIVTISEKNKQLLVKSFGVDRRIVKTIRLSVDLKNFNKVNSIKVLTVARYTERKGFRELFECIKRIDHQDIEFITIGFGELNIRELAKSMNIEDRVTIFDKMDSHQLRYFYNTCDIFCLPSKHTKKEGSEGIPVVLMEAMASEMIIVTTPNGSIPELVNDILVKENDADSLYFGLMEAIALVRSKTLLGKENRSKVMRFHSQENISKLKKYLYD